MLPRGHSCARPRFLNFWRMRDQQVGIEAVTQLWPERSHRDSGSSDCANFSEIWSRRSDLNRGPADYESIQTVPHHFALIRTSP